MGLKCIAWEATSKSELTLDLYNFEGSCGAEWTGKAAVKSDKELQLSLVNPDCRIALCGWCIYDWAFEVEAVDTTKDLALKLGIDTCPSNHEQHPVQSATATLPLDAKSSGIMCRFANFNALGWQAMALSQCGMEGMPCAGTNMCPGASGSTELTCQGDLVCSNNGNAEERICLKACSADSDCGTLGVRSCQDGLCRPKTVW
jgi:hypothetical protein